MERVRTEDVGKSSVRLFRTASGYAGIVVGPKGATVRLDGDDPDALWALLLTKVGEAHPNYFGYDGARSRFLRYFPQGFADPGYANHERTYKDEAVRKIAALLPIDAARDGHAEACAAAVKAFQATNLVFQVEKARIKDVLTGSHGPAFLSGAAEFAEGDLAASMAAMTGAVRAAGYAPSWPMLTYLPFMWRPGAHLFLKPQVTRDFAKRVGHRFARDYDEGVTATVYGSLLDLADETRREIAKLEPRDLIDVQSFIWVVGAYDEAETIVREPA